MAAPMTELAVHVMFVLWVVIALFNFCMGWALTLDRDRFGRVAGYIMIAAGSCFGTLIITGALP